MQHVRKNDKKKPSFLSWFMLVFSEVLFTAAFLFGGLVLWLTFWTGVESAQTQSQQMQELGWSDPGNGDSSKVAEPQTGEPPVSPEPAYGEVLGQLHIPRFGAKWQRNLVEGTDDTQLARHGLGHYQGAAMPGSVGLFAVAGHRAGYGEPLAYINTLQKGDAIVMRTQDYWYVYKFYDYKIVDMYNSAALADVPFNPTAKPTERLMALSSCEPRYYQGWGPTPNRWVAYAKLEYWAKTSDGTPKELLSATTGGDAKFSIGSGALVDGTAKLLPSDTTELMRNMTVFYVIVYLAAAFSWGWPGIRRWNAERRRGNASSTLYSWPWRIQPGPLPIRIVLMTTVVLLILLALFQWGYPWAATHIDWIASSASYATIDR